MNHNFVGNKNKKTVVIPDKKNNTFKIIIILLVVLALVGGIVLLFMNLSKKEEESTNNYIYGTWKCNDGEVELSLDSENFIMDYSSGLAYIEAKYVIESTEKEDNNVNKYNINVTTTKRIIENEELEGEYTTQFQIALNTKDTNNMTMINSISYSIYRCKRK